MKKTKHLSHRGVRYGSEIWIAEDRDDVRCFLLKAIQKGGFLLVLRFFSRGLDLVNFAHGSAFSPKLIILDLNMPGLGGLETLQEVRRIKATATAPIAMFSSSVGDPDIQQAYKLGANLYIIKPENLEEFDVVANFVARFPTGLSELPRVAAPIRVAHLRQFWPA